MNALFDNLLVSSPNGGGVFFICDGEAFRLDGLNTTGLSIEGRKILRGIQPSSVYLYGEGLSRFDECAGVDDIHDVYISGDGHYLVGTSRNEIIKLDRSGRELQRWVFPGERDSRHINCVGMWNGMVVFSAFGDFLEHRGYKGRTEKSGFVQDLLTGQRLISGLSQPHSLVSLGQNLLLANSEAKEVCEFSPSGDLVRTLKFDGYTRGICVSEEIIYVGLSCSRNIESSDIEVATLVAVDRLSFVEIGRIQLPAKEVYSIQKISNRDDAIYALANIASTSSSRLIEAAAEREGQIASLNQAVAERDNQMVSLAQGVAERDVQIASLNRAIAERDTRTAESTLQLMSGHQQLQQAQRRIEGMQQSRSWRMTAPYRRLGAALKGGLGRVAGTGLLSRLVVGALLLPAAIVFYGGPLKFASALRRGSGVFVKAMAGQAVIRERLLQRGRLVRRLVFLGFSLANRIQRAGSVTRSMGNSFRILRTEGIGGVRGRLITTAPGIGLPPRLVDGSVRRPAELSQLEGDVAKRILVADYRIPRADVSAGERATVGILKDLCALGYEVVFLPNDMEPSPRYEVELRALGVEVVNRDAGYRNSVHYVNEKGHLFGTFYIIRVDVAESILSAARVVAPAARVIFHAPDLYFLRETREAELHNDDAARERAMMTRDRELAMMRLADEIVVVSPAEVPVLQALLAEVPVTVFTVLYAPVTLAPLGFAERRDIFFLGGFGHAPNINAVQWFAAEVWPHVRAALPEVEFHIVGAEPPESVVSLGRLPGIKVVGFVQDLDPLLEKLRVGVAPLLYGAGIKGKVAMTMGAGIPCVCTDIAAEGMGIQDRVHARVENDPRRFAEAVVELYTDADLWARLSNNGQTLVRERFGDAANRAALLKVLNNARALPLFLFSEYCKTVEPATVALPDAGADVDVSIIVPVYNKWHLTRACLASVVETSVGSGICYEIILADDGSTDDTLYAADLFPGLRVVKTPNNVGFLRNCNNAASHARGRHILLLNNDTIVLPGWLESLYRAIENDSSIAIVGSKLLYPDGLIQEAGAALFRDGTAINVGRGSERYTEVFNIAREVDYISGASILIRKDFWQAVGGFDERYKNAYCEDSDMAMTARARGMRVVYQPASEVIHFEHQSYAEQAPSHNTGLQRHNIALLLEKWRDVFQRDHLPVCEWQLAASNAERSVPSAAEKRRRTGKLNVLYFSPFPSHPASHGNRATINQFARRFQGLGHKVHFALLQSHDYSQADLADMDAAWDSLDVIPYANPMLADGRDIPFDGWYEDGLGERIRLLCAKYDIDVVFCSYVFQSKLLEFVPSHVLKVIDTHDKMGDRYEMLRRNGQPLEFFSCTPKEEGAYLRRADVVVARREEEARYFDSVSDRNTAIVIPHVEDPQYLDKTFDALRNVGIVASANRINLAIVRECLEAIDRKRAGASCPFTVHVAGQVKDMVPALPAAEAAVFRKPWIRLHGFVPDIRQFYADMDLVVSPVTMGTGINVKTVQAMAYGMPLLTTAWGSKGIETDEPMHKHVDLDALAASLMALVKTPHELQRLAGVSRTRYQSFFDESLRSMKALFSHPKLFGGPRFSPLEMRGAEDWATADIMAGRGHLELDFHKQMSANASGLKKDSQNSETITNGVSRPCKVCGADTRLLDVVDRGMAVAREFKYPLGFTGEDAAYWICNECDFTFTDCCDGWSHEQFSRLIYNADYVKIDPDYVEKRPREMGVWTAGIIEECPKSIRILDYGAGSCVLIDQLKKSGFNNVVAWDPFSSPGKPGGKFDVIICYEVLEHVPNPGLAFEDFRSYLNPEGVVLISTHLVPEDIRTQRSHWWYLGPRNGHISLCSRKAMEVMAKRSNFSFESNDKDFHVLYDEKNKNSFLIDALKKRCDWTGVFV